MKQIAWVALSVGMLTVFTLHAAAPAAAPVGSTGQCKDGSYYDGAQKQGACRGHKGVKDWWGAAPAAAAPAAMAAKPAVSPTATATTAAVAPAAAPVPASPVAAAKPVVAAAPKPPAQPDTLTSAAGGGPGLVWVNASSKVYHCQGDKWYGKTKQGEYMPEAAAKSKGFKGDRGKTCAS